MYHPEERSAPPENTTQARGGLLHMFVPGDRSAADHASLFGRLTRYTRFVLLSKWFLGVFAVVLLVLLIVWPLASSQDGSRISFAGQTAGEDGKPTSYPTMFNPRFQGVDGQMRQYTVTADKAIQQSKDLAQLEKVKGELFFADQSWLTITADTGDFSEKEQLLNLYGNVTMTHAAGYVVVTDKAHMRVKENYAWGEGPVEGVGPTGKLLATGFEIRDNGTRMVFGKQGRVNVEISRKTP